jgi:hypothetical protein
MQGEGTRTELELRRASLEAAPWLLIRSTPPALHTMSKQFQFKLVLLGS